MPTLLDERLVTDALQGLEEWTGGPDRISRTVTVADPDALLAAVAEAADSVNHHPEIERAGDGITFVLWTLSAGGVTELDIALASRIDDLVLISQHKVRDGSGHVRSTVGAPTEEGAVAGRTAVATPAYPTEGSSVPSRPAEAATGDDDAEAGGSRGLMHEPATPRQDAGPIAAPDPEPNSIEPQPGNAASPGMHEKVAPADEG
jgi:4a-hydroxytetrahydrobiopterin dehydratase